MRSSPGLTRRRLLAAGLSSVTVPLAAASGRGADAPTVFVNTFGGTMEEAERFAYFAPFTAATGVRVQPVSPVSFAKLKAQVRSHNYDWDVSSTALVDVQQAILEDLLEPIDFGVIDRARVPPQLLRDGHAVANMSLAVCLVYRKDRFPGDKPREKPSSWADFWDLKRFPGTRSLYDRSFTNLAFALLADGVPLDKLYPLDIERAFRKLGEIKPHIKVWWTQGAQSQQLIRDGEVDMIAMWNARAQDLIDAGAPIEIVWNGAEHMMGHWFVPRGSPRAKLAWQFIAFAIAPERQAAYCSRLPYGPSDPRAFDLIPRDRAEKMPTWPAHLAQSFAPDARWLAPRMASLRERWAEWLVS